MLYLYIYKLLYLPTSNPKQKGTEVKGFEPLVLLKGCPVTGQRTAVCG
jgi:hypothetical protein